MSPAWWLLMSLLWVALVVVIVWAAVRLFPGRSERSGSAVEERPEDILDRRLARGEIDPDTYERLRATLRGRR